MTNYADLIMELERKRDFSGMCKEAANAIKELVAERDRLLLEADPELPTIAYMTGAHDWKVRAEKAEADLAAARILLTDQQTYYEAGLRTGAIAAARAKGGE